MRKDNREQQKNDRSFLTVIVSFLFCVLAITGSAYLVFSPSYEERSVPLTGYTVSSYMNNKARELLSGVTGVENVKGLPYDFSAPDHRPNEACFFQDGGKDCYKDDSIEVACWCEKPLNSLLQHIPVYFAEIRIKHASQFRRQWAMGDYNAKNYQYPSNMFKLSNGVVGMSADFYKHRKYGIIIQYGTVICDKRGPCDMDVLTVDYSGNFNIRKDSELSSYIAQHGAGDIMLSFTFGPALIQDGQAKDPSHWKDQKLGYLDRQCGRAVISQLGEYHYLLCTVSDPGMYMEDLLPVLLEKGAMTAYNLDGGQSGTLLFHDNVYNEIAYNSEERGMSDILYFASSE